jgi:hypothetical protein
MALNLYSKESTDNLLSDKLSDAPSDGTTYGRKDGAWEAVGGGSNDWAAMNNAGLASALALNFTSLSYPNTFVFSVGSGFIGSNVTSGSVIGVTQDSTNFYALDYNSSAGTYTASGFTFDSSNYVFMAFKDSDGNWHTCNNGILYSP